MPTNPILLVIAKQPAAGQTKTRLSPSFSAHAAAALYESFLRDTLDIARRVPQVTRAINYWPPEAEGLRVKLLPPWYDVDTIEELQQLVTDLDVSQDDVASYTRRFLEEKQL